MEELTVEQLLRKKYSQRRKRVIYSKEYNIIKNEKYRDKYLMNVRKWDILDIRFKRTNKIWFYNLKY